MPSRLASDGLPARENGRWALEKLEFLEYYGRVALTVTRTFRTRHYLDLFAGPGMNVDMHRPAEEWEGSPLRALRLVDEAEQTVAFTHATFVNKSEEDFSALRVRIDRLYERAEARIPRGTVPPPPQAPAPPPVSVDASVGRTWDAAVEAFTTDRIGLRTVDRLSGLIVSDTVALPQSNPAHARCGSDMGMARGASRAIYTVLVRGDSTRSTVTASAQWIMPLLGDCSTTGVVSASAEKAGGVRAIFGDSGVTDPGNGGVSRIVFGLRR